MFRILTVALTAVIVAAIASVSAQDGAIGTTGGPNIRFNGCVYYQHASFGGGSNSIEGGIRRRLGSEWNDEISSIACNSYCELTVYEHRDFNGAHRTFRGNISYVGDAWNDDISSMVARCSR
jgi:hypothetical protein